MSESETAFVTPSDHAARGDLRLDELAEIRIAYENQIQARLQAMSPSELYDLRSACERSARGCFGFKPWSAELIDKIDYEFAFRSALAQAQASGLDVWPPITEPIED